MQKYSLTTGLVFELQSGYPKTPFLTLNSMGKREIDVGFRTLTYFSPKFHDEVFLKTDIICVNLFGTGCLKKSP